MDASSPLPWPDETDSLFASTPDWRMRAILEFSAADWDAYLIGFKREADIILDQLASDPHYQELIVFPVLFLYRHYLELKMKQLIAQGSALLDQDAIFPSTHSLLDLWRTCRPIITSVFPESQGHDASAVTKIIEEFHSIDPSSELFRYPISKKSRVTIPENLKQLDLANVARVMAKLETFFAGGFDRHRGVPQ